MHANNHDMEGDKASEYAVVLTWICLSPTTVMTCWRLDWGVNAPKLSSAFFDSFSLCSAEPAL